MISTAVVGLALGASLFAGASSQPREASQGARQTEQEVLRSLLELKDAQLRRDLAALGDTYADDYTLTEDDGTVFTKAERISAIRELSFESIEFSDIKVRPYGNAAVVTYRVTVRFRKEPRGPFRVAVTMTWVKQASRWKVVASHESLVRSSSQ